MWLEPGRWAGAQGGDRGAQKAFEDTAWMSASESSGDRCAGQSPRVLQVCRADRESTRMLLSGEVL